MPTFRYVIADVFTDTPLEGNQLAVFTDAREIPEDMLQRLALETRFSETVFVYPAEAGGHAKIRIFTPTAETQFAGHPTLGSAFVLGGPLQLEVINLETGKGIVPVALEREGSRITFGWMSQPLPEITPYEEADALLTALGVERSELPVERYDLGIKHVLVTLSSPEAVARLEPDMTGLARLTGLVGANCFAGSGAQWKTRMFAPGDGIPEDPATGSAAGPIACHLARYGLTSFGDTLELTQGVEAGRPSKLHARAEGTAEKIEKVVVGGSAVIVARGEFRL